MVIKILAFSLIALVSWAPASAASPTVRVAIERSSDPLVVLSWGPPQATLQRAPVVTGIFENLASAASPYRVDTRLAKQSYFQACLTNDVPRLYIWRDTIVQPGKIALEWSPRDWQLQDSKNGVTWLNVPSVPPIDWYFPSITSEASPGTGRLLSGLRLFRTVPVPGVAPIQGIVAPGDIVGFVRLQIQGGRPTYFSYPFEIFDFSLDACLPLPPTADGTAIRFYDPIGQVFGHALTFHADRGWLDPDGAPAQWKAGELACAIFPQSTAAANIEAMTLGRVRNGRVVRILPPGISLNGPLVPMVGGVTTMHQLRPNPDDVLSLYDDATSAFVPYTFIDDTWFPEEPVLQIGDAFFYHNTSGLPLIWSVDFWFGH